MATNWLHSFIKRRNDFSFFLFTLLSCFPSLPLTKPRPWWIYRSDNKSSFVLGVEWDEEETTRSSEFFESRSPKDLVFTPVQMRYLNNIIVLTLLRSCQISYCVDQWTFNDDYCQKYIFWHKIIHWKTKVVFRFFV